MNIFAGPVLFLDRSDINTDEIIPARYLTEVTKDALKAHLLEDLVLAGFDDKRDIAGKRAIVSRGNFGCGSSREHAPWALEVNGIGLVIAASFARIFRQNMFNCGLLAVQLPSDRIAALFERFAGKQAVVETDLSAGRFLFRSGELCEGVPFELPAFERSLVEAGGWVNFADARY